MLLFLCFLLIFLLTRFINKPSSIFKRFNYFPDIIHFLFGIISVVISDPSAFVGCVVGHCRIFCFLSFFCHLTFFFVFVFCTLLPTLLLIILLGSEYFLANSVSIFFSNGRPTFTNGLRKLSNCPYWLINFPVAPFNKFSLFSEDLITFKITFISLLLSGFPEPEISGFFLLILLPRTLNIVLTGSFKRFTLIQLNLYS